MAGNGVLTGTDRALLQRAARAADAEAEELRGDWVKAGWAGDEGKQAKRIHDRLVLDANALRELIARLDAKGGGQLIVPT